ncbi:MAG: hypothetical protein R3C59_14210 [Planctomycetaceae bacterium]
MKVAHSQAFVRAAQKFQCEIVILEPNKLSAPYIGQRLYRPKPLWCKAKTANNENHPAAGLVVSPKLCPDAFTNVKHHDVGREWAKFVHVLNAKTGFTINETEGDRYGCVLHHGHYLYSDYDLLSVTPLNGPAPKTTRRAPSEASLHPLAKKNSDHTNPLIQAIRAYIIPRTGIDLIQHGAAVDYPKADPETTWCHVFRPDGYTVELRNH